MPEIPRAVLSEHFESLMERRVLKAGVFLTFRFDPAFFEQEILPVFLDVPLSHEPAVRLIQLEDAIRDRIDHLAVYYDRGALVVHEGGGSPKLDIRRVPLVWPTGYFHPKNVLLLVEAAEPENGHREQRLFVAALSANLTQAGWWENVEVCHVEELRVDQKSRLRADVLKVIGLVKDAAPPASDHAALDAIRRFVLRVPERLHETSDGVLHPRLYVGMADGESRARESVLEFLGRLLLDEPLNLEVISPYFDDKGELGPLKELQSRFSPKETRVYLPRGPDGKALCKTSFFEAVRRLHGTHWGKLPADLLKGGTAESAADRTVHAKVYRFFSPVRKYEALFVGSVNLTGAAFSRGPIRLEPRRPHS